MGQEGPKMDWIELKMSFGENRVDSGKDNMIRNWLNLA